MPAKDGESIASRLAIAFCFVLVTMSVVASFREPALDPLGRGLLFLSTLLAGVCALRHVGRVVGPERGDVVGLGAPTLLAVTMPPAGGTAERIAYLAAGGLAILLVRGRAQLDESHGEGLVPFVPLAEPFAIGSRTEGAIGLGVFDESEETHVDPSVTHRVERSRVDGGDTATGQTVVEFEPGQRIAALHLPFVPAFASVPRCAVEIDEGDATAKVTSTRTFGARIEVRRRDVGNAESVRVSWSAWQDAEDRAA